MQSDCLLRLGLPGTDRVLIGLWRAHISFTAGFCIATSTLESKI